MINFKKGKNYKLINDFGIHYDLLNKHLGSDYPFRIYNKYDLLVDGKTDVSPEDFWIVMIDLDGLPFAQPISGSILCEKLMSLSFVPVPKTFE